MSTRRLSSLFSAAAFKRLTVRDVKVFAQTGHALLDLHALATLFGSQACAAIPVAQYWFDDEGDAVLTESTLRWSKHRRVDAVASRLAFPVGEVTKAMCAGNGIVIARRRTGPAIIAVVGPESTIENQLCWLFGMADVPRNEAFAVRRFPTDHDTPLEYAANYILRELFIDPDQAGKSFGTPRGDLARHPGLVLGPSFFQ